MKYLYLLFDADDTLFDFPKASSQAFSILCEKNHLPNTQKSWSLFHQINLDLWSAFDRREITKEALLILRFRRFLSALCLERNAEKCNRDYLEALGNSAFPLPFAEEVCRTLSERGHRLYMITNAVASVQRKRLQLCPFGDVFSGAFISEEAGAAKPDAAYYDYVFSMLPPDARSSSLLIGDSLTTDIKGANNAHLPCCWFNPQKASAPADLRIDYEIQDLRELLKITE